MAAAFALGSNGSGQLGIGHTEDVSTPQDVLFENHNLGEFVQIRAGGNHTIILSKTGQVFYSGNSESGACGWQDGSESATAHFRRLRLHKHVSLNLSEVMFCAATWNTSTVVLKDESEKATRVLSFGTGSKGELGLGEHVVKTLEGQLIPNFPPRNTTVLDLAASMGHVVAVLSNGDVYGWGNGRKGQLGEPCDIVSSPRKITHSKLDFTAVKSVCGREFTHILGEPASGKHAIFGSDKWSVISSAPNRIIDWKDVGASWSNIFVLKNNGALLSWGRNDHGQFPPQNLPPLSQIAVGSEHALGLATNIGVLAWGWGEHGNCGPRTTNGDVRGTWNVIASSDHLPVGRRVVLIGAGCATSWICTSDMT